MMTKIRKWVTDYNDKIIITVALLGCEGILPDLISNVMEEYQESKCIVVQNAEEAGDF
jgi:hypothetical protein